MKIALEIARVLLGGFFIFSGLVKARPIEPFEYTLVESGFFSWTFAPYLARFIISGEVILGALLVSKIKYRAALLGTLSLLLIFTVYLIIQYSIKGNQENCGCMGGFAQFSTLQSIFKNLVLLLLSGALYMKGNLNDWREFKTTYVLMVLLIPAAGFISRPLKYNSKAIEVNEKLDVSNYPALENSGKKILLDSAKVLLVYLNPKCSHCKNAANRLKIIHSKNPLDKVFYIFYGSKEDVGDFVASQNVEFPYTIYENDEVIEVTQGRFPRLLYVEDGLIKKMWRGDKFSNTEIESVFSKI